MGKKSRTINYSMSSEFKVFQKNPNAEKIDFTSIFFKKMISFEKWMQNLFFLPFSPGLVVSYDKKHPIKMQQKQMKQIAMLVNN